MSWKENSYVQKYYSSTPNSNTNLKSMNNSSNSTSNNNNNSKMSQNYYSQHQRSFTININQSSDDGVNNNNRGNGQISPIKLNNSTNTRQFNNNNYYYNKSETTSPTTNVQMRYSPKIRNNNSYSWSPSSSVTSPFKQQLHSHFYNGSKSIHSSPEKTQFEVLNRKRNNSSGYSSSSSTSSSSSGGASGNNNTSTTSLITGGALIGGVDNAVAVPNPFGGAKYRDPPPADILPLPPMQWRDCNVYDDSNCFNSTAGNDSFNIIQKLNDSYSRLTAVAVKA